MNAFWLQLLTTAIRALVGSVVWDAVLQAVTDLMSAELSGDEKRAKVQADLRRAFANVPSRLLNLAIEIAVTKAAPK